MKRLAIQLACWLRTRHSHDRMTGYVQFRFMKGGLVVFKCENCGKEKIMHW